jgi:probable rRNA maturation factor
MEIEVVDRQRLVRVDRDRAARIAAAALEAAGAPEGASATIAFVRDRLIHKLNRDYRGKNSPTDVLSFPSGEPEGHLGDVIISTDTALRQSRRAGHSLHTEIDELIIHGILHLCGYDHETDNGQMDRLELRLRRQLLGRDIHAVR